MFKSSQENLVYILDRGVHHGTGSDAMPCESPEQRGGLDVSCTGNLIPFLWTLRHGNMETENQIYPVFVPPGNQNVARVWT